MNDAPQEPDELATLRAERELMLAAIREAAEVLNTIKADPRSTGAPDSDLCGDARSGLHCGVEDRGINDRYEAADYGWQQGVERAINWAFDEADSALDKLQPFLPKI